jgi:hypothetical protein
MSEYICLYKLGPEVPECRLAFKSILRKEQVEIKRISIGGEAPRSLFPVELSI